MELFNEVLGNAGVPDGTSEPPAEAEAPIEVEMEAAVEAEAVPVKAPKKGRTKKA